MTEPKHAANEEVRDPAEDYVADSNVQHHDEEDVPAVLEQETEGGQGSTKVPAEDFESYADPSAEVQEGDN